MKKEKKDKTLKKIIVNGLSVSRIVGALLMPLFFSIASIPGVIAILGTLFITDFLDGKLARHWGVQTKGGSLLDPLGDKVLAFSCMLSLIGTQTFLLIPLFLEAGISAININRSLHGEEVHSTMIGKIKTWFLSITLVLAAVNALNPELLNVIASKLGVSESLDLSITPEVVKVATGITAATQVLTGADYIKESVKQKDTREEKIVKLKSARELLTGLFDEEKYQEDKDKSLIQVMRKKEGEENVRR